MKTTWQMIFGHPFINGCPEIPAYYYAIRRGNRITSNEKARSWDVTMIMKNKDCYTSGWINDDDNGDQYHGSGITKDEFDMLLAFGVEEITLEDLRAMHTPKGGVDRG